MSTRIARKRPFVVQRHLGRRDIVAALRVADEMLGAVGAPHDRAAEPPRGLDARADIRDRRRSWCRSRRRRRWSSRGALPRADAEDLRDRLPQAVHALAADMEASAGRRAASYSPTAARGSMKLATTRWLTTLILRDHGPPWRRPRPSCLVADMRVVADVVRRAFEDLRRAGARSPPPRRRRRAGTPIRSRSPRPRRAPGQVVSRRRPSRRCRRRGRPRRPP